MARSTARDLVNNALRTVNVVGLSDTPSAEDTNNALDVLNTMIESWNLENLIPYTQLETNHTLVSGTSTYTIGSGGDINITRPDKIIQCILIKGTTEYPLDVVNSYNFNDMVRSQNTTGRPYVCRYLETYPLGKLEFYPIPDGESIRLITDQLITTYTLNDAISLPRGYWGALHYNLCVLLYPEYGMPIDPVIDQNAKKFKSTIKKSNLRIRELKTGGGGQYDIDTNTFIKG